MRLAGKVLASASTLEVEVRKDVSNGGNAKAAALVGQRIAEKAKAAGIEKVAFDRSGFHYHGRVKAWPKPRASTVSYSNSGE